MRAGDRRVGSGRREGSEAARSVVRVHGMRAALAILERRPRDVLRAWVGPRPPATLEAGLEPLRRFGVVVHRVGRDDLARLCGSAHHEGIVVDVRPRTGRTAAELAADRSTGLLVALIGASNPHNVGAVMRVAAHFGIAAVLCDPEAARSGGATLRTAQGAAEHVECVAVSSWPAVLDSFASAGFRVVATVVRAGRSLFEAELPRRTLVLFGSEADGLPGWALRRAHDAVTIPGTGAVESLNLATAVAIVAAEHVRRHGFHARPHGR
ncbi:MAG: hypothetical protein NZ898_09980 [Myxococcota bacterium]|nr:hypothetical protein [Myxococcota bacterium]MDW8362237.1 TrmH family RNA methyltransferase [Myxococcales bacterium]